MGTVRRRRITLIGAVLLLAQIGVSALAPTASAASAPAGYDVVLLVGQSNMVGYGTGTDNAADAATSSRVSMWNSANGTIVPAKDPLIMNDSAAYVGPGLSFAKAYAASLPTNRNVLLVGAARGSTGFTNGWLAPGSGTNSSLSTFAVTQANAAMRAAGAGAAFTGIVWDQGETDIIAGGSASASYQTNLVNLIKYFRSSITGATGTTPAVVTDMTYPWMVDNINNNTYVAAQTQVEAALHTLPDVLGNTAWTGSGGLSGDAQNGNIHFSALAQRQLGRRDADRIYEAGLGLPQPETQLVNSTGSFFDIGRGYANGRYPVNLLPTVSGTVTTAADNARGTVAQISKGAGFLTVTVPATTFNGSYTKMAWFRPGASGYYNNLVSANNVGQSHYLLASNNGGTLQLVGGHSDGRTVPVTVSYSVTPPAGAWLDIALVYDATARTMAIYLNGAAVATTGNVAPAPALSGNPVPLTMGSWGTDGNGASAGGLDGAMAGNRVWNTALTAAQISALYQHELTYRAGW